MLIFTYDVYTTEAFDKWLKGLRDNIAKTAINTRITRMAAGNFGDSKKIENISEARIDIGPGYRLYYCIQGKKIIILLLGGDKRTQNTDIKKAKELAAQKIEFIGTNHENSES